MNAILAYALVTNKAFAVTVLQSSPGFFFFSAVLVVVVILERLWRSWQR